MLSLQSIVKSECPRELEPVDRKIRVHVGLVRREDNYTVISIPLSLCNTYSLCSQSVSLHTQEPPKPKNPFQGVGRTLGASGSGSAAEAQAPPAQMNTAPGPSRGLVVDQAVPKTSVQLRLADGTRLVSRFNNHHTVRDVRGFIDASRPGGSREYQLLTMGFPPKQLTDLDLTIEQAGIANSVVIQKLQLYSDLKLHLLFLSTIWSTLGFGILDHLRESSNISFVLGSSSHQFFFFCAKSKLRRVFRFFLPNINIIFIQILEYTSFSPRRH